MNKHQELHRLVALLLFYFELNCLTLEWYTSISQVTSCFELYNIYHCQAVPCNQMFRHLISVGMIGIARNRHIYTSICHNLTQTFSLLNQYKLHSNLWHRIFYLIIWNLWPQCVFLKVFSLIYYLCYVIWIMHAFELQFELCNSAGSSLAQDRGRLESKIEAFNSEVTILKKNLEVKLSRKITLSVLSLIC